MRTNTGPTRSSSQELDNGAPHRGTAAHAGTADRASAERRHGQQQPIDGEGSGHDPVQNGLETERYKGPEHGHGHVNEVERGALFIKTVTYMEDDTMGMHTVHGGFQLMDTQEGLQLLRRAGALGNSDTITIAMYEDRNDGIQLVKQVCLSNLSQPQLNEALRNSLGPCESRKLQVAQDKNRFFDHCTGLSKDSVVKT